MARRILIVDDEETLTFSLYQSFILAQQDFEVVTADNGQDALDKFQQKPFDLIISDIRMPEMNGFDLLNRVKKMAPHTKVILMTAFGSEEYEERALEEGASDYIEKPFELKQVKQKVIELLS